MPRLDFSILTPTPGAAVGRSVAASGVARVVTNVSSGDLLVISISSVQVDLGAGGPVHAAQRTATAWTFTGGLPTGVRGGTALTLTAIISGTKQFDTHTGPPGEPMPGPPEPFEERRFVQVVVAVSGPPTFAVTAPAEGATVDLGEGGTLVPVTVATPGDPLLPVRVSVTAGGATTTSELVAGPSFTTSVLLGLLPLGQRAISVSVANIDATAATQVRTVTGRDVTPPHLAIELPQERANIPADKDGRATVPMQGTAPDTQSGMVGGIAVVAWSLSPSGQRTPVPTPAGGDFTNWTAAVPLTGFGAHTISVWATDNAGNTARQDVAVSLISSFVPRTLAERLDEREYLVALLSFAQEQILVPGPPGSPPAPLDTPALVGVLGQPADRLSQPLSADADRGRQETNELRVPVELLRARIAAGQVPTGPGQAGESRYRETAYAMLLAAAGTSYAQLRLARGATPEDRRALAARLGIRLSATSPDELDRLVLDGPALTEDALETLFGLPATTAADPLRAPVPPVLLTWRLTGQAQGWAEQDEHPDPPRTFAVLADPDVAGAADVVPGPGGDAVRALLTGRGAELADFAQQLDALRAGTGDAAALAAAKARALPGVDLAALETGEAAGQDIGADLAAAGLTLVGFRYLRTLGRLAAAGPLTAAEWDDGIAVLTRAHKASLVAGWRAEETAVTLSPDFFVLADAAPVVNPNRVDGRARPDWQAVLRSRIAQRQDLLDASAQSVAATEQAALPILRDALLADLAAGTGGGVTAAGEELSALFLVDMLAGGALRTTRIRQAVESIQSLLSAKRAGELAATHPARAWDLPDVDGFTSAWAWMGELGSWQSATMAFLFPERHLDPTLLVPNANPPTPLDVFFADIRGSGPFSGEQAARAAAAYLGAKNITGVDYLNPRRSVTHQDRLLAAAAALNDPVAATEAFWVVPMLLAQRLQSGGDHRAALDWYWIVYTYDLERVVSCLHRINTETVFAPDLTFPPRWTSDLDPFALVDDEQAPRPAPYTRYTLLSVIRCHLDFADAEFTRETGESVATARTLYVTARRLLASPVLAPQQPTNQGEPPLPIPELEALRARAEVQLAKLRQGRNIAGMPRAQEVTALTSIRQPTPFRFKSLLDRARQLAAQASQIEAGYLAALEKYDDRGLRLFDALKGVDLSAAQTTLAATRVKEATDAVGAATAQRDKAEAMGAAYAELVEVPANRYENDLLDEYKHLRSIKDGIAVADATIGVLNAAAEAGSLTNFVGSFGVASGLRLEVAGATIAKGALEVDANGVEAQIQANQLKAGIEQRRTEWRLQQTAAQQEALVAAAQVTVAADQVAIAAQEQTIADLQHDQAVATVRFLSGQFTNADLYLWMSGTLGGVYRFFLQQATATARLAQSQLAFERAEPEQALVRNDYWQLPEKTAAGAAPVDRRGLTGAEQLSADIARLDDYALRSERRRLNLSQTFSLARLMPVEFLDFRRTGTLAFATPMSLFDADFPGHYLRMIRQVRTSVVALVPPDRGIRATLYSNGISRVVTGQDGTFGEVLVRHDPTIVALTSPVNATGVFELDMQADMLLPFEGSGVDTTWELRLPPAANPFDLGNVVDVMVTLDYTALHDEGYRGQLTTRLNGDRQRGADCVFSLARDFPDQWYDLHNPADPAHREVTITLRELDFPFGIEGIATAGVAVRLAAADPVPDTVLSLRHRAAGGEATATGGTASTRRGNAPGWTGLYGTDPAGGWTLGFGPDAIGLFAGDQLDDVLLVVSWTGQSPAWAP